MVRVFHFRSIKAPTCAESCCPKCSPIRTHKPVFYNLQRKPPSNFIFIMMVTSPPTFGMRRGQADDFADLLARSLNAIDITCVLLDQYLLFRFSVPTITPVRWI